MSMLLHQLRYDQKAFWRNPASVFFTVAFPVVLLLIFATVFNGQTIEVDGGIEITAYYVPAIITLAVISATMQSLAMSLVIAREDGRLKRGRGTPMPAWVFIAGRVGNSIVVALMMLAADRRSLGRVLYAVPIPWERAAGDRSHPGRSAPPPSAASASPSPPRSPPRTPRRRSSTRCCCRSTSSPASSSPTTSFPSGVIEFANHFPVRDFFQAFFNAYLPGGRLRPRLGQPRCRRHLGYRRPAAGDPFLPLDAAQRLSRATCREAPR